MASNRKVENFTGFGRSDKFTCTIANGQTTNTAVDLLRGYTVIMVSCADCARIPAATKLRFKIGVDTGDTPVDLWSQNGAAIFETGVLPTSGSFCFIMTAPIGAQLVQPVLTSAASGGSVAIDIYGFDPTVQGT